MRPTVLIVDDHQDFRTSARALLESEGFAVVGEAADGAEAIRAVAELQPAIVLLDIQLPGPDGLAVAEQIAAEPDPPTVVLISSRDAAAYGLRLERTPARGFIAKRGPGATTCRTCSRSGPTAPACGRSRARRSGTAPPTGARGSDRPRNRRRRAATLLRRRRSQTALFL